MCETAVYIEEAYVHADLCCTHAAARLPYVTHMRGGYEENSQVGIEEAASIGRAAGVPIHISHFHTRAEEAERLMAWLAAEGVEASFRSEERRVGKEGRSPEGAGRGE